MASRTRALNLSIPGLLGAACLLLPAAASAAVPTTLAVEGAMAASTGGPATDGGYNLTFSLYKDAQAASPLWSETIAVSVKNGLFVTALGNIKPLDTATVASLGSTPVFGVKVEGDPELPRKSLSSVLFSARAATAEAVDCTGCVGVGQLDPNVLAAYAKTTSLAKAATTGSYADLQGAPDLSVYAKLAALAKVASSGNYADLQGTPDLAVYAKASSLAKVATSGGYADLVGTPDLSGFAKAAALAKVASTGAYADLTGAPDLTAYAKGSALAKVAFTGNYTDLAGEPTVTVAFGSQCGTGLVVKGIKADGSLLCIAAIDPSSLPPDGLNEISNNLLTNQFVDTTTGGINVAIPDNNPVGVAAPLSFPDIGIAQALNINVDLVNSDLSKVKISVFDPANVEYVLVNGGSGSSLKTSFPDPTKNASGDLTSWVGKNPKGNWYLKVVDTGFLNNATDGKINSWGITIQTLSSKKVQVKGDVYVDGLIHGKLEKVANVATVRAKGGQTYCAGSFQDIAGLSVQLTTVGGSVRVAGDISVYYGSHSAMRAIIDGKYAGEFGGIPWNYVWQDGLQCTSCGGCGNWTNMHYDRVFTGIPAGTHTVKLQVYTDGACASCGLIVGNGSIDGFITAEEFY
jgi:subtilisin-like proprotein convertase family protein